MFQSIHLSSSQRLYSPIPGEGVLRADDEHWGDVALKHATASSFEAQRLVIAELHALYDSEESFRGRFVLETQDALEYVPEQCMGVSRWVEGQRLSDVRFADVRRQRALDLATFACQLLVREAVSNVEMNHGSAEVFYDGKPDNILFCGLRVELPVLCPIDFTLTAREAEAKTARGTLLWWK